MEIFSYSPTIVIVDGAEENHFFIGFLICDVIWDNKNIMPIIIKRVACILNYPKINIKTTNLIDRLKSCRPNRAEPST
ncbi:hypothetical protein BpHYR1_013815 [Brachionus plicatilis]|uniref:Uncharacterized protein n=1 Tax=Brachionus plicatilis TaxID=10195 RepID=A0A3M7SWX9_BRAPC|nr:hypothetical protein BpHYR1_013815 [Brachionus plicatilis]